ncbi:MAG: sugar-binding protein [Bifidobacteriaceae bacterium]|jgi:putative multiple sugar transport system substrate-binding protein|nr:sugar-binding protein [Bifidobacteriaceae bacterium]
MNKIMKALSVVASGSLLLSLAACGGSRSASGSSAEATDPSDMTIGLSMPTKSLERWNKDGANLKEKLEKSGYKVILSYADNKTSQQTSDIENMANKDANVIVVAAIDGTAVGPAVEKAQSNGAKVIAYDRLVMNTDAVDYYATFDLEKVGALQGQYIIDQLGLEDGKKGPFNVEVFSGSPDDNNAKLFFKGAWDLLQPYFKSGVLVSPSNHGGGVKADFSLDKWQSIGVQNWDAAKAQTDMESILDSSYAHGEKLDAVLSPNDSVAVGVVNAIESKRPDMKPNTDAWPIITGQDCDAPNVTQIAQGKQAMSAFKDVNKLADAVYEMVEELAQGKEPSGVTGKYNNEKKDVPTKVLDPVTVTKDNLDLLKTSGFYSEADYNKLVG